MSMNGNGVHDVVGVGVGPFNLSFAALLEPLGLNSRFFELKEEFHWHPGLLFADSSLQVSFLKDLVTLADPSSRFSFLAFLSAHRRLYRFINADFPRVSRREFVQYFRWVCDSLPNLEFGCRVDEIRYDGDVLRVGTPRSTVRTRNVVLGTGLAPQIPACAAPFLGETVFHASEFLSREFNPGGKRIALVGGGQTGSELMLHLLSPHGPQARELHWVSRRSNLLPMDETAFTNELFTPAFCEHFYELPPEARFGILDEYKLAGNGIAPSLLQQLYRRLYEIEFLEHRGKGCHFHLGQEMVDISRTGNEWLITVRDCAGRRPPHVLVADAIILSTGWEYTFPEFLSPLRDRISWGRDGFAVRSDFSLEWDGPDDRRIYVQNAARMTHGIAEPNLSIMAWRSATIINSMLGRTVYDVSDPHTVFRWEHARSQRAHPEHAQPLAEGMAR